MLCTKPDSGHEAGIVRLLLGGAGVFQSRIAAFHVCV